MKYDRPLVAGQDYHVIEKQAAVRTHSGDVRISQKIWSVYLPGTDEEVYLCPACRMFTGPTPSSVVAHLASHSPSRSGEASARDRAAAFMLLPAKTRRYLLKRLAAHRQQTKEEPPS